MSGGFHQELTPLKDGDTVCIIGAGPGGAACGMALRQEARRAGLQLEVMMYEPKRYEEHRQYNQCIGVLSPPLESILKDRLGIQLPEEMHKKEMTGYRLHSNQLSLDLVGEEGSATWAVSRADFDEFMCAQAIREGVEVNHNRVTALEFGKEDVMIYSEGRNCRARAVVGAFGLDDGGCALLEEATPYRRPDHLNTIITKLSPGEEFLAEMGPVIQAFLMSFHGMEFGAVTPKLDHLSINIAGRKVTADAMLQFLRSDPVQRFLPQHQRREKPLNYYRGKFPISPARNLCGDRYVTIGDAAGLIRPFKGKGINSACLTGIFAARCMVRHGVSRKAFQQYLRDCEELTGDLWYGRTLRLLTNLTTHFGFMDRLLKIARHDPVFMACLFNCVSGHLPYRTIIRDTASIPLAVKFALEAFDHFVLRRPVKENLDSALK